MSETSRYDRLVNRFSATRAGSWMVKHVASRIDPVIFKATNGRFTSTGRPTLPMLALTVPGRKSGEPRTVQLAYHRDGDDLLVVASAMGQERHPAWRYNLEAAGGGEVQVRGDRYRVTATVLSDDEKARLWPAIAETIPQMHTYVRRTDRNIRVFRLTRTDV
ncbi:MAG: nitroreductase family deazaflavin-dependent oxidoreductase [Acidimicrobiia bacterium]